jgi:ribosome-associated translation inhibitor RaiA
MIASDEIQVSSQGQVPENVVIYARDKVAVLIARVSGPVLYAEVKLEHARDPGRQRPALAQATLDLDGKPVRAHVAAGELTEAIDLLAERLEQRVRRHETRLQREGRELHRTGEHAESEHEWHHGDLPSHRPEYFPRPYDERELVRTKTLALDPMTLDEAAFDLDRLGHDFYLFRELITDADSLIFFDQDTGSLGLQQPEGTTGDPTSGVAVPVGLHPPAPVLDTSLAIERLESGGERFVFYTDAASRRGAVVYHRYDGNWGLLTAG